MVNLKFNKSSGSGNSVVHVFGKVSSFKSVSNEQFIKRSFKKHELVCMSVFLTKKVQFISYSINQL